MEAPISASQGPMRSLPRKLESLLSGPKHELRAEEKKKLRILQADLQGLIDNYLIEPSEVVSPALTAHSWMKDVRDLSYDIDDFIYELAHVGGGGARISVVQKPPRFKICRFPEKLKRSRRWVTDEISRFRTRVQEAIRLHKECLGNCKWRPSSRRQSPPLPCDRLVGVDRSIQQLCGLLANDGQPEHRVVSIVGTAGVGKTTLAREVFRKLRGQFQCLAFERTSPKADMKGLLTSVLSQVRQRCPLPDDDLDVHKLIVNINTHLQHKTYLIVIEDLWALSTWDLVNRALPKGNWCTRILTTTETDVIAQTCYADNFKFIPAKKEDNSKFIIKKEPLSEDESRELFSNRAFGKQAECPQDLKEISNEIVKISGGLPLGIHILASLLAHHPASNIEQWNYVRNSLSTVLTTDGSLEKINQALIIGYDDLPHDLKACMLYLCLYEEDCVIWKDDLVKQWIAEGFISAVRGGDEEQVAHSYFGELVNRGLIQPVDTNCSDEILSCSVHHMVLHFIRRKSMEENFCIAVDHSQTTIRLADNVRRLGLHLENVEDATPPGPESMRLSKVRSVAFSGFHKCMPSIVEFRFLQVLNLKLSVDPRRMMSYRLPEFDELSGNLREPGTTSVPDGLSYNLTEISELFLLRYFHLDACHMSVALPTKMQQLKYLVAWEIDAEVTALPSDIVDLPALLYLRIPNEAHLPTGIGRMTCLRTLGVFDLSKNSTEDVMSLGELTSLQDLHLTCSTLQPDNLERNLECLGLAIRKLSNLKCVTLVPADSSRVNTQHDAGASSMSTSWNGFNTVPLPPALLQKLELSRRCCIFSSLPQWIKELTKLRILKIALKKVSTLDIVIFKGLPSLTALSLFIWTAPARRIIFDNEGFSVLKYFKLVCAAPCLEFLEGAMPNVRRLKLGFNANRMDRIAGLKRLTCLNEISIKIGGTGADECDRKSALSVLTDAIGMRPDTPIINVQWVDWNFCGDDEKHVEPRNETWDQTRGKQSVTAVESSNLFFQKEAKSVASASIDVRNQVESSDEHGTQEKNLEEDVKKQADTRTYAAPESTFHLQNTDLKFSLIEEHTDGVDERHDVRSGGYGEIDKKGQSREYNVPTPMRIPLHILEEITNGFSVDSRIGRGGYGDVYKGVYIGRDIAVKLLHVDTVQGLDDGQFKNEVDNLLRVKHPNIVQLLGYCSETLHKYVEHNGENVLSKHIYRALCFEYLEGGSLDKHLCDQSFAPNWSTRYNIIKGTSEGLNVLHKCEPPILHLDLKPANILLDSSMEPKVADFGSSRLFSRSHSHVTERIVGTQKYMPPEFVKKGIISAKNDVFSLGVVIIEIMIGPMGYSDFLEMGDAAQFKQEVLTNWSTVIEATSKYQSEELHQVKTCIRLAIQCVDSERNNRPTTADILDALNKTETNIPKRQQQATPAKDIQEIVRRQQHQPVAPPPAPQPAVQMAKAEPPQTFQQQRAQLPAMPAGSKRSTAASGLSATTSGGSERDLATPRSTGSGSMGPEVSHLGWGHWFTLRELEEATGGLTDENVIGEGGYGIVYRGMLQDSTIIAVKNLLNNRGQAEKEFKAEVEAIGCVRHKNLVRLLGYCIEGAYRMLVYEYVDNGNLDQWLHGDVGEVSPLTWDMRMNIVIGTAKGLAYLHEGLEPKVVHRDVKSSNILLDEQWNAKVSDFGLAKLLCSEESYVTTRVMGTFGYVAPEYASTGMLTERSDVYSFGVLLMEVITGRSPVDYTRAAGEVNLVEWLKNMVAERKAEEVVDPKMAEKPSPKALKWALLVALRCVDPDGHKRPKMGHVIHMLEMEDLNFRDDRKPKRNAPPPASDRSGSREDGSSSKRENQRYR